MEGKWEGGDHFLQLGQPFFLSLINCHSGGGGRLPPPLLLPRGLDWAPSPCLCCVNNTEQGREDTQQVTGVLRRVQYSTKTKHCITLLYRTVQWGQFSTAQYRTGQYSTGQYSTVQYRTIQHNTVKYRRVSTVAISSVQLSRVPYNTPVKYNSVAVYKICK